jgi:serralysin
MADDTYVTDLLSTGSQTVSVTDDGSGTDKITISGTYIEVVEINLAWTSSLGIPTAGMGIYFTPDHVGHRLIVEGVIENATGSNGRDFIQGNQLANLIFGDFAATGVGLNDTLWAGSGNDTVHGGAGDDEISGDNDDDRLFGEAGNDTMTGGAGIDTVEGGAGADSLSGGSSIGDTLSYAASAAGVRIGLEFGATTLGFGGDAAGDQIHGFSNVIGSGNGDRIEDLVKGTVAFGQNDNAFFGSAGGDRLILGGGNDSGFGGAGSDILIGELGRDALFGGNGSDTLRGGNGADSLTGGIGADHFIFSTAQDSAVAPARRDTITDFSHADGDLIDLIAIDANAGTAGDQVFHLIATAFTGAAGELRVVARTGGFLVTGDTDGDAIANFAITVMASAAPASVDFGL